MALTARYTFELGDYRTLVRAVQSRSRFGRWGPHLFVIVVLIAAALVGLVTGWASSGRPPSLGAVARALAPSLAAIALLLVVYEIAVRIPALLRSGFRRLSIADKPMRYDLTEEGLDWQREGMSGHIAWSAVIDATAEPDALVLFISRREGLVLPRRGFAATADFEEARSLAARKVAVSRP